METFSSSQMRQIEKNAVQLGVSYRQLMKNAGTACAQQIERREHLFHKSIVVLCGAGNNGGDGFVIADYLSQQGADITIILCKGVPKTKIADQMLESVRQNTAITLIDVEKDTASALTYLAHTDYIIDCIFGTGYRGNLGGVLSEFLQCVNHARAMKYAVDIPSGVDGDTGSIAENAFQADCTLVLGAYKTAHAMESVQSLCGEIQLLDIGIPQEAYFRMDFRETPLQLSDLPALIPKRSAASHKGDYGRLVNISGSDDMGGAAMMSTLAALRCGVGVTTLASTDKTIQRYACRLMEAMTCTLPATDAGTISSQAYELLSAQMQNATACIIGCGMGRHPQTAELVRRLVGSLNIPIILDADGINAIGSDINILQTATAPMIVTPHPKEFSRLTGLTVSEIQKNRSLHAYQFAKQAGVIVILKGYHTVIALPDGLVYCNQTGSPALAKGGSGDVLAGMLGGFAAQGLPLSDAVRLAVCLHGACGEQCAAAYSEYGVLARDVVQQIPYVLREIELSRL